MKPKYRVLISTRGKVFNREDKYENETYWIWVKSLNTYISGQGNQVNYFIPISE